MANITSKYAFNFFSKMPTTVLCEGADVSAKLPEIADTYSYTVEIIDSNLFNIEISKVSSKSDF